MSDARPVKHSLTLRGHRTSVSLEAPFWMAFRAIAERDGQTINGLAVQIDESRGDVCLASAIRVFVLRDAQRQAQAASRPEQGPSTVGSDLP
jgi:predicted DNA-binding ribbon-helix-helix protein